MRAGLLTGLMVTWPIPTVANHQRARPPRCTYSLYSVRVLLWCAKQPEHVPLRRWMRIEITNRPTPAFFFRPHVPLHLDALLSRSAHQNKKGPTRRAWCFLHRVTDHFGSLGFA